MNSVEEVKNRELGCIKDCESVFAKIAQTTRSLLGKKYEELKSMRLMRTKGK